MSGGGLEVGQTVIRNPRYAWCICGLQPKRQCWCRTGEFKVTALTLGVTGSQTGVMVNVAKLGRLLSGFDSGYFVKQA